jgi:hypothetical protein
MRSETGALTHQRVTPAQQKMDIEATAVLKAWAAQRMAS